MSILARIEMAAGKPIGQLFDLIVGSSVGGIIALMLTKPQAFTALRTQIVFESLVKEVFTKKPWPTLISLGGFVGPKYDGLVLRDYLNEYLPDALSNHSPVAVTTYDTQTPAPTLVSSWNSGLLHSAAHAGLATSAAPTYFPPLLGRWIDGGVVANNPAVVSVMAAHEWGPTPADKPFEPINVLSIGTGITPKRFTAGPWGQAEWLGKIVDVMLDGEAALQHMLAPHFCSKYLRIQPIMDRDIAMDDSSDHAITYLEALGREAYVKHKPDLDAFFAPDAGLPAG